MIKNYIEDTVRIIARNHRENKSQILVAYLSSHWNIFLDGLVSRLDNCNALADSGSPVEGAVPNASAFSHAVSSSSGVSDPLAPWNTSTDFSSVATLQPLSAKPYVLCSIKSNAPSSIDNFVNFKQIFKILSLALSGKFAIKRQLKIPPHRKHVAALPGETRSYKLACFVCHEPQSSGDMSYQSLTMAHSNCGKRIKFLRFELQERRISYWRSPI